MATSFRVSEEELYGTEEEENKPSSKTTSFRISEEELYGTDEDKETLESLSLDEQVNSAMGVEEEEELEEKTETQKLVEAYTPPVLESGDVGEYVDDLKRIGFRNARNLTEFLVDSVVSTNNFWATKKNQIQISSAPREKKLKALNNLTASIISEGLTSGVIGSVFMQDKKESIAKSITEDPSLIDEDGRIKTTETIAGTATDLGIFMAGGWRMSKGLGGGTAANVIGYEIAAQLFMPIEENLFNMIQEATLTEENENLHGQIVLDMLATSPEDTGNERRVKLLVEGLGLGLVIKAVTSLPAGFRYLRNGKSVDNMTEEELEAALETYTREAKAANREAVGPETVGGAVRGTDSEAGVAQIERQAANNLKKEAAEQVKKNVFGDVAAWMTKAKQQYFTSRGYATPLLYEAALNAKYAQRQAISRAGHIGKRLDKAFKSAGGDPKLLEKINMLLTTDLSRVYKVKAEKRVAFFAKQRNIPEEVASEILEARTLIDELSEKIIKTNGFDEVGKKAVEENLTTYIRRSYRAFEDPNYIPTTASREKATNFLAKTEYDRLIAIEVKAGRPLTAVKLQNRVTKSKVVAEAQVKEMLTMPAAGVDYVNQVQRVNKIFKKNEDLSPEIRELLGEIKAPSENILLSISKASRMVEMQTMYNRMHGLGQNKYFFKDKNVRDKANKKFGSDIYTEKIKGTNSVLDGQYTTREIGRFLRNEEEKIFLPESDNLVAAGYRYYIGAKGFAQAMKTTYSHVTHARNVLGGYQFGLANGRLLSHANPLTLKKLTGLVGDPKLLNAQYEEYLNLGVINTSVSVNQFRDLLEEGFKGKIPFAGLADSAGRTKTGTQLRQAAADSEGMQRVAGVVGDSFVGKGAKALTNAVVDKPGEIYMGADDFFKIGAFEAELATLKKAFPNASESVLKQEAAKIVKNTMPNYDQIPKGIKALRNLPLGNFVAFPAEIVRTSVHIVKQSAKELASSSNIIRRRGAQRLTGFAFTNVGFGVIADQSADFLQFTEQEVADRNLLGSGPFSSGRDTIFTRDENGDIYALDTQYLNSYNTISEPIREAYDKIITGELKGQELEDYLGEAVQAAIVEFTTPYVSTSIATGPIASLAQGFMNEDGRDAEGRVIFTQKDGLNFKNLRKSLARSFVPGSLISLGKLDDTGALAGLPFASEDAKPNEYTMQYRDPDSEIVAQGGVNWRRKNGADLQRGFKDLINSYNIIEGRNSKDRISFATIDEAVQDYLNVNTARFQNQQDLYLAAQAADRLFGRGRALDILTDNGFSTEAAGSLIVGNFVPESTGKIDDIVEDLTSQYVALKTQKEKDVFLSKMFEAKTLIQGMESQLTNLPLDNAQAFDPEQELEDLLIRTGRTKKSTGGEVSELIPNAPSEPDERINKLTGIPYNEGAGAAYMDTDDPLRVLKMNKGGSLYSRVSSLGEEVAAEQFGITPEVLKKYTEDTASLVNNLVDEGFFHARERATTDEAGNLSGGDIFDAANHLRTAVLAEDSQSLRNLAQLKELAQFVAGDRGPHGALGDSKNNLLGFEFYDKAEGNKEKFETLVKQNLIDRFSEREGYSAAGAVVKAGMKLFSKTKVPVPTKAAVKKTKDIAMPEELNPKVSNAEYDEKTVDMSDKSDATLKPYKEVERFATKEEMYKALAEDKRQKIDIPIEEGSEVGIRLDIPAYQKGKDSAWVPTIHDEKGTGLTSHRATVALRNVNLKPSKGNEEQAYRIKMKEHHIAEIDKLVSEGKLRDKYRTGDLEAGKLIDATSKEGRKKIAKIKKAYDKTNYSRIKGNLINRTDEENYRLAQEALNSDEWTQVGYNPDRHSYYFDRKTGEPVLGGDEGIQVGPLVLIKNAEFGNRKDFKYASGGKVLNTLRRARN
tara:strand:- start:7393 stop:13005 length:5613 start_codon:yes stop_codon:yes gene_type:complete